jgi:hypothetical protein
MGSLNDINVLNKSAIVGALLTGKFDLKTPEPYVINGTTGDLLASLIWFVSSSSFPSLTFADSALRCSFPSSCFAFLEADNPSSPLRLFA